MEWAGLVQVTKNLLKKAQAVVRFYALGPKH